MSFGITEKALPLVKVVFSLGTNEWHGFQTESVWAEKIDNNRCRIRNTPFYVKGVSCEDVVFIKDVDGVLFFDSTSMAAGHSTYRILLNKSILERDFLEYWVPLEGLGCTYESSDIGKMILYAVNVPSNANIHEAYSLLERAERDGVWEFEEGHCGHPI